MAKTQLKSSVYSGLKKIRNASVKIYLDYLDRDSIVIKFWDGAPNWGDSLNYYLIKRITGKNVVIADRVFNFLDREVLLGIGSVISGNLDNHIIWGSGFLNENSKYSKKPKDILAVRGLLTAGILRENGLSVPDIYGDPALLFQKYFHPPIAKKYSIGFIPHFKENQLSIVKEIKNRFGSDISLIDMTWPIEDVAIKVLECECVISSSLHGLILAESYNIPTCRVSISDKVIGGDFKFNDYYSGVGCNSHAKIIINSVPNNLSDIKNKVTLKEISVNLDEIEAALLEFINSR